MDGESLVRGLKWSPSFGQVGELPIYMKGSMGRFLPLSRWVLKLVGERGIGRVLTTDLPAKGLQAGDVGTVVHIHKEGEAFEFEYSRERRWPYAPFRLRSAARWVRGTSLTSAN
jgi:hypothetical protein